MSESSTSGYPSLAQLHRIHKKKQERLQVEKDKLRKELSGTIANVTNGYVDTINSGVATVFENQKHLDQQAKGLDKQAASLHENMSDWLKLMNQFHDALKELGDVQTWTEKIEEDMSGIAKDIEFLQSYHIPPGTSDS